MLPAIWVGLVLAQTASTPGAATLGPPPSAVALPPPLLAARSTPPPRPVASPTRLRVALLPVLVEAGQDVTSSAIFRVVSEQVRLRKTLRLMSIDEFFFNDGGARADGVVACGSDTRCVARQLAPFQADLGLVVIVNGQLDPTLVGVLTLDTRTERLIAEKYEQVDGDRLWPTLRTTIADHLDRAGHPRWARIEVRVTPANAAISVSPAYPAEIGRPSLFVVPPGTYTVRADLPDHGEATALATAEAGATAEVFLALEKERAWYESPWVWVGAAVVVGAAVAATTVALQPETTCGCVITADRPTCPPCP